METRSTKLSAIVLAAGRSTRIPSDLPKQLLKLGPDSMIIRTIHSIMPVEDLDVKIVLGYRQEDVGFEIRHLPVDTVVNNNFDAGQTSSLKRGIYASPKDGLGYMILPVDYPLIATETIVLLVQKFRDLWGSSALEIHKPLILVPTYRGEIGRPVLMHSSLREEILALDDETPGEILRERHSKRLLKMETDDEGVVLDIDTSEDYRRALEILGYGDIEKGE